MQALVVMNCPRTPQVETNLLVERQVTLFPACGGPYSHFALCHQVLDNGPTCTLECHMVHMDSAAAVPAHT